MQNYSFLSWVVVGMGFGMGFTVGAGVISGLAAPAVLAIFHRKSNNHKG